MPPRPENKGEGRYRDYDGRFLTADNCGIRFLTFIVKLRKPPERLQSKIDLVGDRAPGSSAWETATLPLLLSGCPLLSIIHVCKFQILACHSKEKYHSWTKISLLTSKLNIELREKLVRCYVWSIALYGSETLTLKKLERKYLESFEMGYWRRTEKTKWSEKVNNEHILERIGERRILLNNILCRKAM